MNIEQTTDFSSYLNKLHDDSITENEPEFTHIELIPAPFANVLTNTYSIQYKGTTYDVMVSYPGIKDVADYYHQGLHLESGVIEFYIERITRKLHNGLIADYTKWFELNEDQYHHIGGLVDKPSEEYFKSF
jgi:hypothetical protein